MEFQVALDLCYQNSFSCLAFWDYSQENDRKKSMKITNMTIMKTRAPSPFMICLNSMVVTLVRLFLLSILSLRDKLLNTLIIVGLLSAISIMLWPLFILNEEKECRRVFCFGICRLLEWSAIFVDRSTQLFLSCSCNITFSSFCNSFFLFTFIKEMLHSIKKCVSNCILVCLI